MKNILEIKNEILSLEKEGPSMGLKEKRKAEKRVVYLRKCLWYLESNPNESFIVKLLSDLKNRLMNIGEGYELWKKSGNYKNTKSPYTTYKNEMGVKKIKDQISTLNFILK